MIVESVITGLRRRIVVVWSLWRNHWRTHWSTHDGGLTYLVAVPWGARRHIERWNAAHASLARKVVSLRLSVLGLVLHGGYHTFRGVVWGWDQVINNSL